MIGVLPGVVGLIQATETVKLILGIGESLVGRLLCFDALAMKFKEVRFKRRADCPTCSPIRSHNQPVQAAFGCSSDPIKLPVLPEDFYIEPLALKQLMERGDDNYVVLDVRDANELEVCKLAEITHIPLIQLKDRLGELNKAKPHVLVCYGGMRSERAASTLLEAGFANAQVLKGGMKRWVRDVEPDMPIY